ncbi:TonB-dependent receptor [Flexithrix dorotheae]|uniref:TonB-dependent receptor n=1 Tax=Flexithrix dorotheae TaxID=70993 RepID=UPI00036BB72D|nr:TonB-dependent receptor [Flexithrix dorotheae]
MNKYIKILLLLLLTSPGLFAQGGQGNADWKQAQSDLEDAKLLIEKEKILELPTAPRDYSKMTKVEKEGAKMPLNYQLQSVEINLESIDPPLSPVEIVNEKPLNLDQTENYFKAGVGNYQTPYLEGYFNMGNAENYQYGVYLRHLSSQTGPVDKENSGTSNNNIDIFGDYFIGNGQIHADLGYDRRMVHFYGYDSIPSDITFDPDSIKQIYNIFKGTVSYRNEDEYALINYETGLKFYTLSDKFTAKENNFDFFFNGQYDLSEDAFISAGADVIFAQRTDSSKINRNLFLFNGAYNYHYDKLTLKAGLGLAYNVDSLFGQTRFNVYPDLRVKYLAIEDKLAVFARVTGKMEQQTIKSTITENAFMNQNFALAHTNHKLEAFAGIEAGLSTKLGLNINGGYSLIENLPFFVNNPTDQSRFEIFYDDKATGVLNVNAELSATIANLRATWSTSYFSYSLDTISEAWHQPTLVNKLLLTYNHEDRLFLNLDFFNLNGIKARDFQNNETITLDPILDLNIKADYLILDNLSAFLAVNNIFAKKYQRYYNYKVKGINALVGVTYTFDLSAL